MQKIGFLVFVSVFMILVFTRPGSCQNPEDWYQKGLFFNRIGQYEKAIDSFSRAVEIDPQNANAYNNRGAIWYLKENYGTAIEDYTKALELKPDVTDFYINRAAAWFKTGDFKKTIADYDQAIRLDPRLAHAFNNRGMTFYFMGEYDKAVADHTRAIELNSEISQFYNNLGAAWFRKEKDERAIVAYSRALGLNPKSFNALRNRGIAWFKKGFNDRAINDYTRALEIDAKSSDVYVSRGMAFYQAGDYDKALLDFVDGITHDSENIDAINQLAWMLSVCPEEKYRNGIKALEMAQKAVRLYSSLNTLDTLASALAEAGRFSEAVALQEKIISQVKSANSLVPEEYTTKLDFYASEKPWRAQFIYPFHKDRPYPIQKSIQATLGNIRSEPIVDSFVIEKVKQGCSMMLLGRDDQWFLVEGEDGQLGWAHESIFSQSIVPAQAGVISTPPEDLDQKAPRELIKETNAKTVRVMANIGRIREFPKADAGIKYKVIKGDTLVLLEESQDWYRVSLGKDKTGWAHKSLFLP
ncbi:MAG: tetratricopeptide repeat protein [Pseudomonadota bacterium]